MAILSVGIGFMLLLSGRPLYAVFTGAMGFLIGRFVTERYSITPAGWNDMIMPLLFAAIGAGLAFVFRRWSARLLALVAGAYVTATISTALGAATPAWSSSPIVMGLVGVVFMVTLIFWFDYALIFISALTAATMILEFMFSGALGPVMMFIIMVIFGLLVQFLLLHYGRSIPD